MTDTNKPTNDEENCLKLLEAYFEQGLKSPLPRFSWWPATLLKTLSAQQLCFVSSDKLISYPILEDNTPFKQWFNTHTLSAGQHNSPLGPMTVILLNNNNYLVIWQLFPQSLLENPSSPFFKALSSLMQHLLNT